MKRGLVFFLAALLSVWSPSEAFARRIEDVTVDVRLCRDGSAEITQVWKVEVDSGTEWYLPVGNLGEMEVRDLRVFEEGREYVNEGTDWDVDRSLEEKRGRCGIVRKGPGSVELCWGEGSYGPHVWTAAFTVTGLVQALRDRDAFNFMFVNPGLIAPPEHALVRIRLYEGAPVPGEENAGIWAFGFEGEIRFEDGGIVAESSAPFGPESRMILMAAFEKGIFTPSLSRDMDFEEMRERAFAGSDYSEEEGFPEDETAELVVYVLICLILLVFIVVPAVRLLVKLVLRLSGRVYAPRMFGVSKAEGFERDAPFGGDLVPAVYTLMKGLNFAGKRIRPGEMIGAFFMKWLMEGRMEVRKRPDSERVDLALKAEAEEEGTGWPSERRLYQLVLRASGRNRILEKSELKRWAQSHYAELLGWPERVAQEGRQYFTDRGWVVIPPQKKRRRSIPLVQLLVSLSAPKESLTPEGRKEAVKVIRFKNFLKNFTLVGERGAMEVKLWKNYLVFAQLYGIAGKVARQFRKLYPRDFEQFAGRVGVDGNEFVRTMDYVDRLGRAAGFHAARARVRAENQHTGRYSGGGGRSSFGGGGGYSGGGSGGGSR